MTAPDTLLDRATPRELAISLTSAGQRPLPHHLLRIISDPWRCPIQFLPLLARAFGVDIWRDEWPEAKQRRVVAMAKTHKRHKGTEWLHGEYLKLIGADLVSFTAAHQLFYPRRNQTAEERAAFLSQFQQIRIYPKVPVTRGVRGFTTASAQRSRAFVGHIAPTAFNTDLNGLLREARLFDPLSGEETVLTRKERAHHVVHVGSAYDFETIMLPGKPAGFVPGMHLRGLYCASFTVGERLLRVAIEREQRIAVSRDQWSSVVPSGQLVSVRPELIRQRYAATLPTPGRMSTGHVRALSLRPDPAWRYVHERFYLFDRARNRGVTPHIPGSYCGHARLGIAAHTAELKIRAWSQSPITPFRCGGLTGSYLRAHTSKTPDVIEATAAARKLSDVVKITTCTRRKLRFSDRPRFGFKLGQYVED